MMPVYQGLELTIAIAAQSISNATVNGATLSEPWTRGSQLAIVYLGGAFSASASGRLRLQGLARSDGTTWSNLKEHDGTTDLEFTAAKLDDAGAGEGAALIGTLDLSRVDSETYKAVRVTFQAEHASATQLVAVGYLLTDLYARPSAQTDELWSKARAA